MGKLSLELEAQNTNKARYCLKKKADLKKGNTAEIRFTYFGVPPALASAARPVVQADEASSLSSCPLVPCFVAWLVFSLSQCS